MRFQARAATRMRIQEGVNMHASCEHDKRLLLDGSHVPLTPAKCGTTRMRTQGGSTGAATPSASRAPVGGMSFGESG